MLLLMKKSHLLAVILCLFVFASQSQLLISNNGSAASVIAGNFVGTGIAISNPTISCPSNSYGTFTNGQTTNIGISSGVVLSTGNIVTNLNGPAGSQNFSPNFSTDMPGGSCNDPQLNSLEALADYDCCILEFDVVPQCDVLTIRFVFGSEEYPEYVSSGYNDAFGFFVTGSNPSGPNYNNTNVATLPDGVTIASIDNINSTTNSAYYINNNGGTTIRMDGFTTVLTSTIEVVPCNSYHFKLAIADAGDGIYDSAVLIDFLQCNNIMSITTDSQTDENCGLGDGSAAVSVTGGFPYSDGSYTYSWSPSGGNAASATGLSAGTYTLTVDDNSTCTDPVTTTIDILPTSVGPIITNPGNQTVCDSYTLPAISGTNLTSSVGYFTGPNGTGTQLSVGSAITLSQTVYIHDVYGTCTDDESFVVTVNVAPDFSVSSTDPTVCNGSDGTITLSGLTPSSSFSVSYDDDGVAVGPLALTTDASGNITISGLNAGAYDNFSVTSNGCTGTDPAVMNLNNPGAPSINNPGPVNTCDAYTLPAITGTNLTSAVSYWTGTGGTGSQLAVGTVLTSSQTVYIYDANGACTDQEIVAVNITNSPVLASPGAQTICDSYTLPAISGSNLSGTEAYWTAAGGTGTSLAVGTTISSSQTIFIYDAAGTCIDEVSFPVTINNTPSINNPGPQSACGSYTLPAITGTNLSGTEAYYNNTQLSGGTVITGPITSTQTVYIYGADGACSNEVSFQVTINTSPSITNPGSQTTCDVYTLPAISGTNLTGSQAYYSGPNGTGSVLAAGTVITSDQTVYIYDNNGTCDDNESVSVTVNTTPTLTNPGAQTACDGYTLPTITGSNMSGAQAYYDDSQSNGGALISGTISSTQTVWIYDADGNCSDEESFLITINPLPTVNSVDGGANYCVGDAINDITVAVTGTALWTVSYTLDGTPQTATGSTSPVSLGNAEGVYVINAIADANCNNTGSFGSQTIVINPIPSAPTAGTDSTYCSSWDLENMFASGSGGTYTWYSDATLTDVISTGTTLMPSDQNGTTLYYVTETTSGCEGPASIVAITINDCDIIVPTAFTPDGDNANDVWEIVNLDYVYPDNLVTVYNRWGGLIYQSEKGKYSDKPWDGTYNGEPLPVASYYFIIDFNNEEFQPVKGIVSIVLDK